MELCRQSLEEGKGEYWREMLFKGYLEGSQLPGETGRKMRRACRAFYEREEMYLRRERSAVRFQIEYGEQLMRRARDDREETYGASCREKEQGNYGTGSGAVLENRDIKKAEKILMDAGENCLEHFMFHDGKKVMELLEELAKGSEDDSFRVRALCMCARLADGTGGENGEQARGYYEMALSLLEQCGRGSSAKTMKVWDELADVYCRLGLYEQEERCRENCDYELLAKENVQKLERDAGLERAERLERQMEAWKDGGDKIKMGSRTKQDNGERLEKAGMCYRQAADIWKEMEAEERERSLYLFGRIMDGWSEAETMRGNQAQAEPILARWHRELMGQYKSGYEIRSKKDRSFSWQLSRLAERFGRLGDKKKAILCTFERGIAGLKEEYEGGSLGTASDLFFGRAAMGISEDVADEVLEVCDIAAGLCGGERRWQEIEKRCKRLAERYREDKVSFK